VLKFTDSKETRLDIVRVSGVMFAPTSHLTSDGYDLQFGTNVLGNIWCSHVRNVTEGNDKQGITTSPSFCYRC